MNAWEDVLLDAVERGDADEALERITAIGRRIAGTQAYHFEPDRDVRHLCSARVDDALIEQIRPRFFSPEANPLVRDLPGAPIGRLCHVGAYTDFEAYLESDVYREFSRPMDTHHAGVMVLPTLSGSYFFALGVKSGSDWFGENEAGDLTDRFRQLARALDLHAERALGLGGRTGPEAGDGGEPVLSGLMLDERGRAFLVDSSQRRFLATVPLLRRCEASGTLRPVRPEFAPDFARAVERARTGGEGRSVILAQDRPYVVTVRVGPRLHFGGTFHVDARPPSAIPWTRRSIGATFGLTPRESDVVLALLDGLSVAEAAARCGIKERTVRTYLGHVFDKTRTRSQAQLLAMLSR